MLLGTLGASLLGNLLKYKGAIEASQWQSTIKADEGIFTASEGTIRSD